ncbi:hypothetical protein DSO57_1004181 [Entomophthora muscae]|uniref:Uncharacterized protein n=1 Tax=Entomophthora muscae TaxID=34485 RepID=A0ACC2UV75_9FUNG|nr:hypothetical protein DSO57_1004181 [Entomophthora muscae]
MMTVYPIVTALTGFQVANLVPYFAKILPQLLGLYRIGGYQHGSEFFGPSQEGLGHDHHYDPGQLNFSYTGSWLLIVSPHLTLSLVAYTSMYYVLTYFVGSFGRYNVHSKVFWWLMIVYSIATTLTGFQFSNLLPSLLQVVPTVSGYYTNWGPQITKWRVDLNWVYWAA